MAKNWWTFPVYFDGLKGLKLVTRRYWIRTRCKSCEQGKEEKFDAIKVQMKTDRKRRRDRRTWKTLIYFSRSDGAWLSARNNGSRFPVGLEHKMRTTCLNAINDTKIPVYFVGLFALCSSHVNNPQSIRNSVSNVFIISQCQFISTVLSVWLNAF